MITAIEAAEKVRSKLITGGLKTSVSLTGSIYPANRPLNSIKEDIVVSALSLNGDQVQEGLMNVNIHIPSISSASDGTQPNLPRFNAIAVATIALLDDKWDYDFNIEVEEPGQVYRDKDNSWFCNIRVRFYSPRD